MFNAGINLKKSVCVCACVLECDQCTVKWIYNVYYELWSTTIKN